MTMNEAIGGAAPATQPELQTAFLAVHEGLRSTGHLVLRADEANEQTNNEEVTNPRDLSYEAGMICLGRHIIAVAERPAAMLAIEPDDVVAVSATGTLTTMDVASITVQRCTADEATGDAEVAQFDYSIFRRVRDTQNPDDSEPGFVSETQGYGVVRGRHGEQKEVWEYDPDTPVSSSRALSMAIIAGHLADAWAGVIVAGLQEEFDITVNIPNN